MQTFQCSQFFQSATVTYASDSSKACPSSRCCNDTLKQCLVAGDDLLFVVNVEFAKCNSSITSKDLNKMAVVKKNIHRRALSNSSTKLYDSF